MLLWAHILFVVSCVTLMSAQRLDKVLAFFYYSKYELLESPSQWVKKKCSAPKRQGPCHTQLAWREKGSWKNVCESDAARRRFPPRYYALHLNCELGFFRLKERLVVFR